MSTETSDWRERLVHFVQSDLWSAEAMARHGLARVQGALQVGVATVEGFIRDSILLRASALTYYAVLSIIPLLSFALSLARALGVDVGETLINLVVDNLAPGNPAAAEYIIGLVSEIDFASLGTIGAAILFGTTVLSISSIEKTLNTIWGVRHERTLKRRFSDYLAVLVVAPLLLGVSLSLGTTLQSQAMVQLLLDVPAFDVLLKTGLRYAPLVLLWLAFSFLYWFLPNRHVRLAPALIGGVLAALMFFAAQRVYVAFNVGVVRANALYGSLAALPLLLVWIYVSWLIVLLGAEITAAYDNLASMRRARRGAEPRPAARESIGLAIATIIARRFDLDSEAVEVEELADRLEIPLRSVQSILDDLEAGRLISLQGDQERQLYQLGRSAERIPVAEVLEALRGSRATLGTEDDTAAPVQDTLAEVDRRSSESLANLTLADLAHGRGAGIPG